jgi:hypothetical protein
MFTPKASMARAPPRASAVGARRYGTLALDELPNSMEAVRSTMPYQNRINTAGIEPSRDVG